MERESICISVDIPASLYNQLKEEAEARGYSIHELILVGIKKVLRKPQRLVTSRVSFPLIVSSGPKVEVSYDRIYANY